MPSARETYKDILIKSKPTNPGEVFTSKSVNVQGRMKITFLVLCSTNCDVTVEWSYDQSSEDSWSPLHGLAPVNLIGGRLLRITIDDALTYLRIKVDNFAGAGQLSAWTISL